STSSNTSVFSSPAIVHVSLIPFQACTLSLTSFPCQCEKRQQRPYLINTL
ncbi:hypothetical protein GE21DRAFT_1222041, partial [Neurospora crassa]